MGSRRQSDARPSVTYQEDIEKVSLTDFGKNSIQIHSFKNG